MPRKKLEAAIAELVRSFATEIIEAVKKSSLAELTAVQAGRRRGRKPGVPAAVEAAPPKRRGRKPGRKRKSFNYPKCKIEGCGRNRYARGQGFCGMHFKEYAAGKIDLQGNPK